MKLLSDILIYSTIITAVIAANNKTKFGSQPAYHTAQFKIGEDEIKVAQSHDGRVGVSSIAGISTRNGRVSSFSGVYSHPGMDSPMIVTSSNMGDMLSSFTKNGGGKSNPSTITKKFDNKYATGTVNISPGSVSVTSVAKAGPVPQFDSYRPMSFLPVKPIMTDPFLQRPFPMFEQRYNNPWFPNNFFKNTVPSNVNRLTPPWFHPSLYPYFNYWP